MGVLSESKDGDLLILNQSQGGMYIRAAMKIG